MTPTVSGIPIDGAWTMVDGELDGAPARVRVRKDLLPYIPNADLGIRITIRWKCRHPFSIGLPSPSDVEELWAFEDALVAFVECGAILAFILSHGGVVKYNFYTSDKQWFEERLNEALADKPIAPIEIESQLEADWFAYKSILERVGVSGFAA